MNPFALAGFAFLGFYLLASALIASLLLAWNRRVETAGRSPQQSLTDPYLIAYLRAGENEALRVATVALLDRGLLTAVGGVLTTKNADSVELAKRPIEKAILNHYLLAAEAHKIFKSLAALGACRSYRKVLVDQGMIADAGVYFIRLLPTLIAAGTLIAISWTKVNIALSQGRHNVVFLIFLTVISMLVVIVIFLRRRTGLGDAMMADLRSLFGRLKGRATSLRAGGQTNEAALLAAVFGLSSLPVARFPFLEKLYPKKASDGSGCGSSCGSSSGCGGGCGGGGCGG